MELTRPLFFGVWARADSFVRFYDGLSQIGSLSAPKLALRHECRRLRHRLPRGMEPLEPPDTIHLQAARGWLDLGNHVEANEELEQIGPQNRGHPDVLELRWLVYAAAKRWDGCVEIARTLTKLVPDWVAGWVHLAYALHELKRTQEAWDTLLPVADRFPDDNVIPYNLACYAAQLGKLEASKGVAGTGHGGQRRSPRV